MSKKYLPAAISAMTSFLVVGLFLARADSPRTTGHNTPAVVQRKLLEVPSLQGARLPTQAPTYSTLSATQNQQTSPKANSYEATLDFWARSQDSKVGLSYETVIPRPTKKGYYEPKIVPYPTGKPVAVRGYYRKNGTYVQPHFRSLPGR
jgi:hypothetical protein